MLDRLRRRAPPDAGSFLSWSRRHGWPAGSLELHAGCRAAPEDEARAIPLPEPPRLWARSDIPLRERTLRRLLYDSAARTDAALGLDLGDLDLANRQARSVPTRTGQALLRFLASHLPGTEDGRWEVLERLSERLSAPTFVEYVPKSTAETARCQRLCSSAAHPTGLAGLFIRRLLHLCTAIVSIAIAAQGD